jgi:hypothetical protein
VKQKFLGSFEMFCWRRTEKISWTDRVKKEIVLYGVKNEGSILHTIDRKNINGFLHLALEMGRIDRGKDRSDGKTRKKK